VLVDEFVDGAKGAALPLIRHDLGLSYDQVGLLASVPLLVGGFLELPLGVLAGRAGAAGGPSSAAASSSCSPSSAPPRPARSPC